jgi:hypothetical protein
VIADAIFCAIAGLDYYHAIARALIPRGLETGLMLFGWTRQLIDAAARRRRVDQEDLRSCRRIRPRRYIAEMRDNTYLTGSVRICRASFVA